MTDTTTTTIAAITPSDAHVEAAEALGINPAAMLAVIQTKIADAVQALKQLVATMPSGDSNIAAVNAIIATLV